MLPCNNFQFDNSVQENLLRMQSALTPLWTALSIHNIDSLIPEKRAEYDHRREYVGKLTLWCSRGRRDHMLSHTSVGRYNGWSNGRSNNIHISNGRCGSLSVREFAHPIPRSEHGIAVARDAVSVQPTGTPTCDLSFTSCARIPMHVPDSQSSSFSQLPLMQRLSILSAHV